MGCVILAVTSAVSWMDLHAGTGSWVQGILTLVSVVVVAIIASGEGRRAFRIHNQTLAADAVKTGQRLVAARLGALAVAQFASTTLRTTTEYAEQCPELAGIDVVYAPDFSVIRQSLSQINFGDLEDNGFVGLIHRLMIICIKAQRILEALSRIASSEDMDEDTRRERLNGYLASLRRTSDAAERQIAAVASRLGFESRPLPADGMLPRPPGGFFGEQKSASPSSEDNSTG